MSMDTLHPVGGSRDISWSSLVNKQVIELFLVVLVGWPAGPFPGLPPSSLPY